LVSRVALTHEAALSVPASLLAPSIVVRTLVHLPTCLAIIIEVISTVTGAEKGTGTVVAQLVTVVREAGTLINVKTLIAVGMQGIAIIAGAGEASIYVNARVITVV